MIPSPILYTITSYLPSIGGAQLHLHAFAHQVSAQRAVGVIYQWDENRTDWLLGTTINAPPPYQPQSLDGIPAYRLSLTTEEREQLRLWVRFYRIWQGAAIEHISNVLFKHLQTLVSEWLGAAPGIVHNSRVGREGLTVASLKLAHALDIPFVLTPNHHPRWKGWLYRHYLNVYRAADAVIVYSQYEHDELCRLGVSPARIHRLGIGPILSPTSDGTTFRQRFKVPPDAPMVLYLGQKHAYKRFTLILDAMSHVWAHYPQTRFVFIGPRTSYSQSVFRSVPRDARLLELDTVDLQTKTDALAACEVLCVPSGQESFGGVYIEAGQMGKPVIGGDAPAIREVIREGKTGFIVGPDASILAERLIEIIADPDLRASFGQAGQVIAQHYQWADLGAQLAHVYTTLA
jgi:glycosyltransferase involved in cell wall biosynthesis